TIINDKNIELIGLQQTPIVTVFDKSNLIPGEKDVLALGNGFQGTDPPPALASLIALQNQLIAALNLGFEFENSTEFTGPQTSNYLTFASVPGNGLGIISIDSNIYIAQFQHSPPPVASNTPSGPLPQGNQSQAEETITIVADTGAVQERQIVIERLDEEGNVLSEVKLPEAVLDNLDGLFETLKNGRFRISVIEPGESKPRILLDNLNLRGGKPAADVEEGEKPPTINDAGAAGAALPAMGDGAVSIVRARDVLGPVFGTPIMEEFPVGGPVGAVPLPDRQAATAESVAGHDPDDAVSRTSVSSTLAGVGLGLGALAISVGTNTWEERVDATLRAADAGTLSKAARLARRLRFGCAKVRKPRRRPGRI
ncbi:MAG TPA: hypothetical protein VGM05_22930, partial [Planctomycetaceae bacterium]